MGNATIACRLGRSKVAWTLELLTLNSKVTKVLYRFFYRSVRKNKFYAQMPGFDMYMKTYYNIKVWCMLAYSHCLLC